MRSGPADRDEPYDSLTGEPAPIPPEGVSSVLTPMGEVQSLGSFARGLGPRRVKLALAVGGGLMMLLALLDGLN